MKIEMPFNLFPRDLALDLGTANTLIYAKGLGIMLSEPSMIALSEKGPRVLAVGKRAKDIYGKNPKDVKAIRPLKDGVIADIEATQLMISAFLQRVMRRRCLVRPRIIACVPSGITPVERRAVFDSMIRAGARKVYLIEEPMAAAIGAKLPIEEPIGNMIVDIGGGTTEVAIITSYGVESWDSIRIAGDEMDESIRALIKQKYNLRIGIFDAEKIKMEIGSAVSLAKELKMEVKGKDLRIGLPKVIAITSEGIREALNGPLHAIVDLIRRTLERTAPELAGDIWERGIVLAGGGALIQGLPYYLEREIGVPFRLAEDPLAAIVRGAGRVLEEFTKYRQVCLNHSV